MKVISNKSYRLNRLAAVLKRWRDILIYGLLGAIIATAVATWLEQLVIRYANKLSFDTTLSLGILVLIAAIVFHKLAGTRLSHLRYLLAYPPLPVAVLIGLLLLLLIESVQSRPTHSLIAIG